MITTDAKSTDASEPTSEATLAARTGSAAVEREKRQWWAVDTENDDVRLVMGYSCAPNSPTYWWIPDLGASLPVGFMLFETEREAIVKLITRLTRRVEVAHDNIEALKQRDQRQPLIKDFESRKTKLKPNA